MLSFPEIQLVTLSLKVPMDGVFYMRGIPVFYVSLYEVLATVSCFLIPKQEQRYTSARIIVHCSRDLCADTSIIHPLLRCLFS